MRQIVNQEPSVESLDISRETLAFIIVEARALDVQNATGGPGDGGSPGEDGATGLFDGGDGATASELSSAIRRLSADEQVALVALTWIGRGDFDAADWEEAKATARERRVGPTSRYLMGIPLLGDYLEEGAAALGVNLADEEAEL
ncbi:DUF3775 domain-containing protein [Terricaulis sp.]|uniref:DUF3775 domain-containing protein n=1 Tax=Terricaulis sp. TaxID=2768686 RepID=UPI003784814D